MHTEKVNGMNGRSRAYGFLCSVLRQENSTFLFGLIATVLLTFFVLSKGLLRRYKLLVLSFACTKERTKEKCSQKQKLRCFWQANAQEQSLYFVITFFIEVIGRSCCCVLFATHGGAVFFVWIRYRSYWSYVRRKKRRWKILSVKQRNLQLSSMQMIRIV